MTNLLNTYSTAHIPLAAYLRVKGIQVTAVTVIDKRGTFTFNDVPREMIIEFNNGTAAVEPAEYASKMSQMTQTAKRLMREIGV